MFDRFEKIFVINLAKRTDRRNETKIELLRNGSPKAIFYSAFEPVNAGKFRSIGEHGCFISHFTLLKECIGCKNVLIMEDDVHFAANFGARSHLVDGLDANWDIFYAGYRRKNTVPRWKEGDLVKIDNSNDLIGTHCYAVNGGAVQKLVQAYETFMSRDPGHPSGGPMSIDGAMNVARRQLRLHTFVATPPLAFQRSSRTDVGERRWFDEAPRLTGAVQLARQLKNKLRRLTET
ncbi:MAG TPA: glycosyltransferase family 25 protein [Aestuariivirga sp.]|nr:glycosyltransferase family 25 protein [Aestuariivirga sp.]